MKNLKNEKFGVMKKLLLLIMSLLMLFSVNVSAEDSDDEFLNNLPLEEKMKYIEGYIYEEDGITYECQDIDDIIVILKISSKTRKDITIPTKLKGKDVIIWSTAFEGAAFESVTIPDGTETLDISINTSTMLDSVKQVNLPDSLKVLGNLSNLHNLEEIKLPSSLVRIDEYALAYCENLKSISIPDGVKVIGKHAFAGCTGLQSVEFPNSLETIADRAFTNCKNLTSLTLPKNLKQIENFAFSDSGIEKVAFKGKTTLGYGIFDSCPLETVEGLTEEEIIKNWDTFGNTPFGENYKPTNKENEFVIQNGVLKKYIGTDTEIVIPDTVKTIGQRAFYEQPIKSVVIPSSVTKIDSSAFGSTKLTEVTIPSSVTEIGHWAFGFNPNLKKVTIEPSNHRMSIVKTAFDNCENLTEFNVPDNIDYKPSVIIQEPEETQQPDSTQKPAIEPTVTPTTTPEPRKLEVTGGEEIKISVDEKAVVFPDAKPFIDENDRTQVPVRAVSEMLECDVDWLQETQTVTITNGEKVINIVIGEDLLMVNGEKVQMDTKAIIKDERTFIPVRFIAEALGLTVEFR